MSQYTPVVVTPIAPAGAALTLPMPESVEWQGSTSVTFTFADPWPTTDLRSALAPALSVPAEKIVTGRTLANIQYAIAAPGAVLVDANWGEVEPFGGGVLPHTARGLLALPTSMYDRSTRRFTVVLYVCAVVYLWGGGSLGA